MVDRDKYKVENKANGGMNCQVADKILDTRARDGFSENVTLSKNLKRMRGYHGKKTL